MLATCSGDRIVRAWIAAAAVAALLPCGCRHVETVASGDAAVSTERRQVLPPSPSDAEHASQAPVPGLLPPGAPASCGNPGDCMQPSVFGTGPPSTARSSLSESLGVTESLYCGDSECLPPNFGDTSKGLADLANTAADQSAGPALPHGHTEDRGFGAWCNEVLTTTWQDALRDYSNYYTRDTMVEFIVILAPAAVFANTDWDAEVATYYQEHIRSPYTNRAANFVRPLGNGFYTIPVYVSAKLLGEYLDDLPGMGLLGEWGDRTTRALLVGAPPLLAVQSDLAGGRPSIYLDDSYWRPFRDSHGASGHAFMGAVPFLYLGRHDRRSMGQVLLLCMFALDRFFANQRQCPLPIAGLARLVAGIHRSAIPLTKRKSQKVR